MPHVLEEMEESSAYTHAAEFGDQIEVSNHIKCSCDVQVNNENLMASVKMIMP